MKFYISSIALIFIFSLPVLADETPTLTKETKTFSSDSSEDDASRITAETRGLSGWKKKEDSCKYAEQAAKRKAESECNKKKGIHLKFLNAQCYDCRLSRNWNEWYCSARVVAQCSGLEEVKSPGAINKLRGLLRDSNGQPYTESNNPCTKDANTIACKDYRKAKQAAIGVRG